MNKENLRSKIKNFLNTIDEEAHNEMSFELSNNLTQLLPKIISNYKLESTNLGVFVPILKEPIWYKAFDENFLIKNFCLVHMKENRELSFHPVGLSSVKSGKHNLKLDESILSKCIEPQVILVPGVAFTKNMQRLGRGKGYYDIYLQNKDVVKIGLCFEGQIEEDVFNQTHDVEMNYVITEKNIYGRGLK